MTLLFFESCYENVKGFIPSNPVGTKKKKGKKKSNSVILGVPAHAFD